MGVEGRWRRKGKRKKRREREMSLRVTRARFVLNGKNIIREFGKTKEK